MIVQFNENHKRYPEQADSLTSAALMVERTAYSLAGYIDTAKVSRLILIAAELETFNLEPH